jgi:hypothetical protein
MPEDLEIAGDQAGEIADPDVVRNYFAFTILS